MRRAASPARLAPGLALAGAATLLALGLHRSWHGLPTLTLAVVLGIVVANAARVPRRATPGLAFAAGPLLKVGIVLLGFELVLGDVITLGAKALAVVLAVVVLTFAGTTWLGRRLGVSRELSLLVGAGFSICGVSAIAAANDVVGANEEDVTFAVALVTLCGSLAIIVLPALRSPLGLDATAFGAWTGASVHDVAQVVATASTAGPTGLATAVVVKLTRVLLLAPLVGWIAWRQPPATPGTRGFALLPPFVVAFLAAAALRSAGILPSRLLATIADTKTVLLAMALFALGTRVELRRLLRIGSRPIVLGLVSWALIATVAYIGVRIAWS